MPDNFYNEDLGKFEFAVEQFKAQLRECVRDEWVNEMARLREENAKYADIKARLAEIEAERQREREEVERVKDSAANQARRERLDELFKNACPVIYTLDRKYKPRQQCGKCDSNRLIHYKNPVTGKDMSETCPYCGYDMLTYFPRELYAYEAKQFDNVLVWYKDPSDDDSYAHAVDEFSDDKPFHEIKSYRPYFKSRERCQAYCDLRTELERVRNQEA